MSEYTLFKKKKDQFFALNNHPLHSHWETSIMKMNYVSEFMFGKAEK